MLRHVSRWSTGALESTLKLFLHLTHTHLNTCAHKRTHTHSPFDSFLCALCVRLDLSFCHSVSVCLHNWWIPSRLKVISYTALYIRLCQLMVLKLQIKFLHIYFVWTVLFYWHLKLWGKVKSNLIQDKWTNFVTVCMCVCLGRVKENVL